MASICKEIDRFASKTKKNIYMYIYPEYVN